jgi:hypothetical protein
MMEEDLEKAMKGLIGFRRRQGYGGRAGEFWIHDLNDLPAKGRPACGGNE